MNYLYKKGKVLLDAVDAVLNYNDLRSNQNPEVRRFIEEYHAVTFEIYEYRNTPPTMNVAPGLAETIVARIDAMNEMLMTAQSTSERATFEDANTMRKAYRLDELNEVRREIQAKIDAAAQQSLVEAASFYPSESSSSYYNNANLQNGSSYSSMPGLPQSGPPMWMSSQPISVATNYNTTTTIDLSENQFQ